MWRVALTLAVAFLSRVKGNTCKEAAKCIKHPNKQVLSMGLLQVVTKGGNRSIANHDGESDGLPEQARDVSAHNATNSLEFTLLRNSGDPKVVKKMLAELVVETIRGNQNVTPGLSQILKALKTQMADVLAKVLSEKVVLQSRIDASSQNFTKCGEPATYKDSYKQAADSKEEQHAACRVMEADLKNSMDAEHTKYRGRFPVSEPACRKVFDATHATPLALDDLPSLATCFGDIKDLSAVLSSLMTRANSYKIATEHHTQKKGACAELQNEFESAVCSYHVHFEAHCSVYSSCFDARKSDFDATQKMVEILEASHKSLYTLSNNTLCLVEALEAGEISKMKNLLERCSNITVDTKALEVTYGSAPIPHSCVTHKPSAKPCNASWIQEKYSDKKWFENAPAKSCVECVIPTTNTTARVPWEIIATDAGCNPRYTSRSLGPTPSGKHANQAACQEWCEIDANCNFYLYRYDPITASRSSRYFCAKFASCDSTNVFKDGDGGHIYRKPAIARKQATAAPTAAHR